MGHHCWSSLVSLLPPPHPYPRPTNTHRQKIGWEKMTDLTAEDFLAINPPYQGKTLRENCTFSPGLTCPSCPLTHPPPHRRRGHFHAPVGWFWPNSCTSYTAQWSIPWLNVLLRRVPCLGGQAFISLGSCAVHSGQAYIPQKVNQCKELDVISLLPQGWLVSLSNSALSGTHCWSLFGISLTFRGGIGYRANGGSGSPCYWDHT